MALTVCVNEKNYELLLITYRKEAYLKFSGKTEIHTKML